MPRIKAAKSKAETNDGYSQRQMNVLRSSAEVFYEKGFHGTSMRDIARRLGVRQASLYHHFDSKIAILEAICRLGATVYVENIEEIKSQDISTREKIHLAVYRHLEPFMSHHFYVEAFIYMRRDLPKDVRKPLDKIARHYEMLWEDILREGQDRGEISGDLDVYIGAMGILGMMNTVLRWSQRKGAPDLNEIAENFSVIVCDGVCM